MPRLLSLNVGLPRDIAWQGRTVHTGIWKAPVQGRRMVQRLNIDGDGQFNSADIAKLVRPLLDDQADFVTCSRFADPALRPQSPAHDPVSRLVALDFFRPPSTL